MEHQIETAIFHQIMQRCKQMFDNPQGLLKILSHVALMDESLLLVLRGKLIPESRIFHVLT